MLSRPRLAVLLAIPAAVACAQSPSDEEDLTLLYGDAASVTIATGNPQALRRAPAVASVITAAEIANMGVRGMDDLLETVAGIHVARAANSWAPIYVVRGVYSFQGPQVLVLQNGVPITTLFQSNKGNMWGDYPVELISRLEIIRGPGSALYGSDAFSGVINIITKGPVEANGTEFGLHAGSFATRDAWAQHGGKLGPVSFSAYIRAGRTDGFHRVIDADAQTRNDRLLGTRASLAPGPVNTGNEALDANLDASYGQWRGRVNLKQREVGTGAGIASALDPVGRARSTRAITNLAWTDPQWTPDWGLSISVNAQSYSQTIPVPYVLLPPGVRFPTGTFTNGMIGAPATWERNIRLAAVADYSGLAGHHWRLGAGHDDLDMYRTRELRNFTYAPNGTPIPAAGLTEYGDTDPFLRPHRRRIDYIFVQDEWRLAKDWNLTAGVRRDRYSDFGSTVNPRIALVWDATFDLTTKLLYGRAFRAPSYNEAYSITNPVTLGNPGLAPETNGTLEAVASWQPRTDVQLNATLYRYAMDNIIRLVPQTNGLAGQRYNNTGRQTGHGAEFEAAWAPERTIRFTGNYAWQRSIDLATQTDAGYAPHHHLYARADWELAGDVLVSPQLTWVAGRRRPAGDTRPPVADYRVIDVAFSTRLGTERWHFSATVRNLFNADVREPSAAPGLQIPHDLPMAPRALSLQATCKL
ncbi:hypothetical protein GCM10027277_06930 [Pseudoduganella ginsengisoli]|uniref:TonB-dependent receptor n=1 Tax=Pseudoduganella ginsengisoli TaxID=1462440 RepID=A0A6L6Q712_9BURK|nr:TonB-dependent receptor [Pseudoduganella ginsengisoli]MTW05244.1 TonB-dependent receptor [Pseudoduganella ginsengisoli]